VTWGSSYANNNNIILIHKHTRTNGSHQKRGAPRETPPLACVWSQGPGQEGLLIARLRRTRGLCHCTSRPTVHYTCSACSFASGRPMSLRGIGWFEFESISLSDRVVARSGLCLGQSVWCSRAASVLVGSNKRSVEPTIQKHIPDDTTSTCRPKPPATEA